MLSEPKKLTMLHPSKKDWRYEKRTSKVMGILLGMVIIVIVFSKISKRNCASKENFVNVKK